MIKIKRGKWIYTFLILLHFLGQSQWLFSQTTTLQDPQFRNFLKSNYPSMLDSTDRLIIAKAGAFTGSFTLENLGMVTLSDLQYFPNLRGITASYNSFNTVNLASLNYLEEINLNYNLIHSITLPSSNVLKRLSLSGNPLNTLPNLSPFLYLKELYLDNCQFTSLPSFSSNLSQLQTLMVSYNQLTYLPDLSPLVQLKTFYCYNNQLDSIGNLSSLVNLEDLRVNNNNLRSLPDLSQLAKLWFLDCSRNHITNIPGLDKAVAMKYLYCHYNNLSSLPDISNLTKLEGLNCSYNQLTQLPGLSGQNLLINLVVNNNMLTALPPLPSAASNLEVINCSHNQLTALPSLSNLTKLKILKCTGNKLTSLPSVTGCADLNTLYADSNLIISMPDISGNLQLDTIVFSENKLSHIADYSSLSGLTFAGFINNYLSFEDMVPNIDHPAFNSAFQFFSQKELGNPLFLKAAFGSPFTLRCGIDTSVSDNIYEWYKDNLLLSSGSTHQLILNNAGYADTGTYICKIRNSRPELSNIILQRAPISLEVVTCFPTDSLKTRITPADCNKDGELIVDTFSLAWVMPPYDIYLKSTYSGNIYPAAGYRFSNLTESNYTLIIKDGVNCVSELNISIPQHKEHCKKLVLTPGGDGKNDSFFIEQQGRARIYNSAGQLVREIQAPGYWDGSCNDGTIAPGYYIIKINNSSYKITVIY